MCARSILSSRVCFGMNLSFNGFLMNLTFSVAVRKKSPKCRDSIINSKISKFFSNAVDRNGGRQRRRTVAEAQRNDCRIDESSQQYTDQETELRHAQERNSNSSSNRSRKNLQSESSKQKVVVDSYCSANQFLEAIDTSLFFNLLRD